MFDVSALSGSSGGGAARTALAQNFEMFLTLLTEQLKNQDPLSPLDSNEFVSQLVQFSSVEQQMAQNRSLEQLIALQVGQSGAAAVAYIGREAAVLGTTATLAEGRAVWRYDLGGAAETVSILVKDSTGKVVYETTGELTAGAHEFVWDGKDAAGVDLPDGVYEIEVAARDADDAPVAVGVAGYGKVTGVDFSGAEPSLLFGSARAPFSSVIAVRLAS